MRDALKHHWPEYLMEAAELGIFMLVAGLVGVLMEDPASPLRQAIPDGFHHRILTGAAMGLTAISIIYSPLGKQSGAHFNPSVTLTFLRLGKIGPWDACSYIMSQFLGGIIGLMLGAALAGNRMAHPAVHCSFTCGSKAYPAFSAPSCTIRTTPAASSASIGNRGRERRECGRRALERPGVLRHDGRARRGRLGRVTDQGESPCPMALTTTSLSSARARAGGRWHMRWRRPASGS